MRVSRRQRIWKRASAQDVTANAPTMATAMTIAEVVGVQGRATPILAGPGRGKPERRLADRQEPGALQEPGEDPFPEQHVDEPDDQGARRQGAERGEDAGIGDAARDRRQREPEGRPEGGPVGAADEEPGHDHRRARPARR